MVKRIYSILLMLLAVMPVASAYDFSQVVPSGQTLYFNTESDGSAIVVFEVFNTNTNVIRYSAGHAPTGNLIIPSTVTHGGRTYTVKQVGGFAFAFCTGLVSVVIPDGVTVVGSYAFKGCTSLTTVTIGSSVVNLNTESFYGCSSLSSMTMRGMSPPTLASSVFTGVPSSNVSVYVPCGRISPYEAAPVWGNFGSIAEWPSCAPSRYTVLTSVSDSTLGIVVGGGLHSADTVVDICAVGRYGCAFIGWNDGDTNNPRTIEVNSDTAFMAMFLHVGDENPADTVADTLLIVDTLVLHDTLMLNTPVWVHDTVIAYITQYEHDTIFDTLYYPVHDTVIAVITHYLHDTIFDTLYIYVHDTVSLTSYDTIYEVQEVHDTVMVTDTLFDTLLVTDTLYITDTVYIHDTIYLPTEAIGEAEVGQIAVFPQGRGVVVKGATSLPVSVFDIAGKKVAGVLNCRSHSLYIPLRSRGTYLVKVGLHSTFKVTIL